MDRSRNWNAPFLLFLVTAAVILCPSSQQFAQIVEKQDFNRPVDGMAGEEHYEKIVQIGPKRTIPISIDITAKGNGWMKAANLHLRVFKEHDDGEVFDPPLLHVEFVDITGDGCKDLVVVGTLKHTGEKETDPVTTEPIASIYTFDPKTGHFNLRFRCGPSLEYDAK